MQLCNSNRQLFFIHLFFSLMHFSYISLLHRTSRRPMMLKLLFTASVLVGLAFGADTKYKLTRGCIAEGNDSHLQDHNNRGVFSADLARVQCCSGDVGASDVACARKHLGGELDQQCIGEEQEVSWSAANQSCAAVGTN